MSIASDAAADNVPPTISILARRPPGPPVACAAVGPQPVPLDALVLPGPDGTYVARHWADRDRAIAHCRLCNKADCFVGWSGVCLVKLDGDVPEDEAALRPMFMPALGRTRGERSLR